MVDIARHAEVARLLEEIDAVADQLTENEREMVESLRARYADPGHSTFDDPRVLEVILRNVRIREGYDMDASANSGRKIPVAGRRSDDGRE